jgi:undecaprenyl-diphosphatase
MVPSIVSLDHSLFYHLYNLSGRSQVVDFLIVFFGEYLIYLVILFVFWHAYRMWRKGGLKDLVPYAEASVSVVFARGILEPFIHLFYDRVRPFIALSLSHNLIIDAAPSFPSGHTIVMFALATSVYFYDRKFGWFLYVCGILIGLGRVAGGVHYPSDILGGAVLGIIVGWLVYAVSDRILKKSPYLL